MKRIFLLPCFAMMSILLAAYGPMTIYASAQSVTDAKLQDLKQKATDELNRRIEIYKKTLNSLDVEGKVDGGNEQKCMTTSPSQSTVTSLSVNSGKLKGEVSLPCGLEEKVTSFMQQIVKELTSLLGKVESAKNLSQMQSIGQNVDNQFGLNQLTQVQAAVTQAVGSFSAVFSNLKATYNNLQSQIVKLKDCAQGAKSTSIEADANATDRSVPSAELNCQDYKLNTSELAVQAQAQLDSLTSAMTTLGSILLSAVSLLTTLVAGFGNLAGDLGNKGSLGNLGNLSNMLSPSQLSTLSNLGGGTSGAGSITGLLGSFTAITSQLDIANFMSENALDSLTTLGNFINIGGLNIPG